MRRMILLSMTLILAAACSDGGTDTPEQAAKVREQALAPRAVKIVAVEAREEHAGLQLVGEVRADELVIVPAEVAGKIERVLVEVGDRVERGQELAWVDRETFRLRFEEAKANVAAAEADLTLAGKELERKRDLLSDHTISQAAFDQAEAARDLAAARLAAAQAARDLAESDVRKSVVRASDSGVIARRMTSQGQWADVGQALLELATGDRVKVAAKVPGSWSANLSGIKSFEFQVGGAGAARTATIYSIQPVVEGASRSLEVVGLANNTGGTLRPGMFATVHIESPAALTSLWVPATAVAASDMPEVMQAVDGKVEVSKVQTGRRDQGMVEIVSGLEPGETVIAEVAGLTRGLPVKVENDG